MKTIWDAKNALNIDIIDNVFHNVEEYDEQYGALDGVRVGKKFYRIDKDILSPLIDEMQNNPNCSYKIYVEKLIKEGFVPKHISCMIKQLKVMSVPGESSIFGSQKTSDELHTYKEVLTSQILNFYECPTVYNAAIKEKDRNGFDEYKILSVDFMREGQDFQTFDEFDCSFFDLEKSVSAVKEKILSKINNVDNDEKRKFEKQFVMSYLVRNYVVSDADFYPTNIGVLNDTYDNKINVLNFDFEHSLYKTYSFGNLAEDLAFVNKNYPEEYNKFIQLTKVLEQSMSLLKIKNPLFTVEDSENYIYRKLKENLIQLNNYIDKINCLPSK